MVQHRFYPELESLRGVAAMFVAVLHIILYVMVLGLERPAPQVLERLGPVSYIVAQTGITIFNGRSAVTLFFVLSGFVMGLGFDASRRLDLKTYGGFLIKRFFRLLPALWAAIIFAMALGYFCRGQVYSVRDLFNFLLLLDLSIDAVSWTLVLELAVCLIYPLLLFSVSRITIGAQIVGLGIMKLSFGLLPLSLHYGQVKGILPVEAFYLGLIVPTAGRAIVQVLPRGGTPFIFVALACFMAPEALNCFSDFNPDNGIVLAWISRAPLIVEFACFYIISWLLYSPHRSAAVLLQRPSFTMIGRWSYSIYIFHYPITQAVRFFVEKYAVAAPMIRLAIGLAIVIPATLVVSALSYRYIERPFTQAGRRLIGAPVRSASTAASIGAPVADPAGT